jgi:predicted RNA-binding protein with RPS1 domain
VHISQLAWSRVNHPSEVLHIGQEVEVQVLSVDKEKKKIALSIKRAELDPWTTVGQRYTSGQVVIGTVTKIAPFGVFASIEEGVEGFIHLSEITPGTNLKTDLHEGQQLQLRILRIDAERRRLGLSMRQAEQIFPEGIPGLLEGNAPEPFSIVNVYLPLSRDAKGCIQWAKSFATQTMQSALVLPEHLLLSVLRCQRMRQFLTQLLPATEPLLAGLTGEMGYTNYIDQLIRTRVRQTIRQEAVGKSTTTVRPVAQANLCPSCKRPVQTSWKHCVYCGASLVSFCPNCGAPRAEVEGVQFCYECGSRLEKVTSVSPKQIVKRGLQSGSNFSKGQGVRILDGPFTGYIGTVSDIDTAQNKVTVLISFFGKETQVVLDFLQVEKI